MQITKRIDLNLGYSCNIRCRFCYYQKSMQAGKDGPCKDLTTVQAKKWILFFRKKGMEAIDLTGGEPTIRQDIVQLIRYAGDVGYKTVCIITNGVRLADEKYAAQLAAAGLNDVLFSLHGPDIAIHENLTQAPRSFDMIIAAIRNMTKLGIRCRSNTVVNGISYKHVLRTADLLYELGVKSANFILFNPIVEAQGSDRDMNVSYAQAAPYLKEVIDRYKDKMERITIRYMPFCLMRGYEGYVTNTAQIQYDSDEWDYYWRTYFRNGPLLWFAALSLGFLLHPSKSRLFKLGFDTAKHEAIKCALAFKNKVKGPACRKCAYNKICDGLWRSYAKNAGFAELVSVSDPVLSDPAHFMHDIINAKTGASS